MISEVSSVQPAQTNERTANIVIDCSSPIQTQMYEISNDIYRPIQQKLKRMTESTPLQQTRIHLHLNKISKQMWMERVLSWGISFESILRTSICIATSATWKGYAKCRSFPPWKNFCRLPWLPTTLYHIQNLTWTLTTKHQQPGPQPADIFRGGQNDCNLLFYVKTKKVFGVVKLFFKISEQRPHWLRACQQQTINRFANSHDAV